MDWCGPGGNLTRLHRWLFGHVPPWEEACCIHDALYVDGGLLSWRAWADRKLRMDIAATGHPVVAWLYWIGVRVGARRWWGGR